MATRPTHNPGHSRTGIDPPIGALSGVGWLTFLSPPLASYLLTPIEVVGILAEGAPMPWLLVIGVNSQRWTEQFSMSVPVLTKQ